LNHKPTQPIPSLPNSWSPELLFLIDLVGEGASKAVGQFEQGGINSPIELDWNKFRALANSHRVQSIVAHELARFEHGLIPENILKIYKSRKSDFAIRTLAQEKTTADIAQALITADIDVLLLKSTAVAARFYKPRNLRQYKDIDFLISESQALQACDAIRKMGFEHCEPGNSIPEGNWDVYQYLSCDTAFVRPSDGVQLELHWRVERNRHLLDWDIGTNGIGGDKVTIGDTEIATLNAKSQFVFLCSHGAKHSWFRLRWMADIYRMLAVFSDADISDILEQSELTGTQRMVATSLELAGKLFGLGFSDETSRFIRKHSNPFCLRYMMNSIAIRDGRTQIRAKDFWFVMRTFFYRLALRTDVA